MAATVSLAAVSGYSPADMLPSVLSVIFTGGQFFHIALTFD